MKPFVGLTMGDPSGIGPEIILKSLFKLSKDRSPNVVVFGDFGTFRSIPKISTSLKQFTNRSFMFVRPDEFLAGGCVGGTPRKIVFVDFKNYSPRKRKMGFPSAPCGKASGDYIDFSIKAAHRKIISSVVTAPISKVSFYMSEWGQKYVGHTEMFGKLTNSKNYGSMVIYSNLRALPVTYHVPLSKVSRMLSVKLIQSRIKLLAYNLKFLGLNRPKIVVCGLNPHAGDKGLLGNEEIKILTPAIWKCRQKGIHVRGPFSSDVVWPKVLSGQYDVGLAMYHDQAQIPIKLLSSQFSVKKDCVRGLLATLGLPFTRFSPLHGTAYDIAGKGKASPESMIEAIKMAEKAVS